MSMDAVLARNTDRIELLTEAFTDVLVMPRLVGRWVVQVQSGRGARRFAEDEIPSSGFTRAIEWLLGTTNVLRSRFHEFRQEMGRKAFTIANVMEETIIERVKRSLGAALEDGEDLDQWKQRLDEEDESGLSVMDQVGIGALQPYHAETVFRAAWQNSYQVAIKEGYEQTRDTWAYYEYVTMDDDRVRASHAAMHGVRRPTSDPIWRTWWPPNGYNCRCTVVAISHAEANYDGLRPSGETPTDQPDDGWEGEPR